jgi:hypothetical protein
MFCSGCGQALAAGQAFCPQCGRPTTPVVPPIPGLELQVEGYAAKIRTLSIFWFVYAGLSLVIGFAGLAFADAFFSGRFAPWMQGPLPPMWMGPAILHFAWIYLVVRSGLALAAGWGLWERAEWGRVVAIIAAVLSLLKFPFGTAIGIWTLVVLLGYRNTALYDQL